MKILEAIEERLTDESLHESLRMSLLSLKFDSSFKNEIRATLRNDGNEIARDVRLVLPGKGKVQVSEDGIYDGRPKQFDWAGSVGVGDLRPGGAVSINAWPSEAVLFDIATLHPAVAYLGGSGTVREPRSFYGWGADVVAWFTAQNALVRYGALLAVLVVVAELLRLAVRRGHLVLRPNKPNNAE